MQEKRSLFSIIVTSAVSLLVVTSFVFAVTTISTDVTTDGIVTVSSGSSSAPSYSFVGDTNTGIFRQAADVLSVSLGGSERLRYSSAAFAFQEATTLSTSAGDLTIDANDKFLINDDTGIGYTDTANQVIAAGAFAINKNVGIGTTNPVSALDLANGVISNIGNAGTDFNGSGGLTLASTVAINQTTGIVLDTRQEGASQGFLWRQNSYGDQTTGNRIALASARGTFASPSASQDNDAVYQILSLGYDGAGGQIGSSIIARTDGIWSGSNRGTDLEFWTVANGATSLTQRWTILSSGNLQSTGGQTISTSSADLTIDASDKFLINDDTGINYTDTGNQVIASGAFAINKNVGIGTTNPNASLHISGTDASYLTRFSSSSGTGTIQLNAPTGANTNFYFAEGGTNRAVIFYQIGGVLTINRSLSTTGGIHITASDDIGISYNNTGNNVIASGAFAINKNVGIGTTNPAATALLDITSTTKGFLPSRMTTTQRDAITFPATGLLIYNSSTNALNVFDSASWTAVGGTSFPLLASSGSQSAPSYSFTGDTNTGIYSGGADILRLVTAGADRLTLDAAGNVGIGTTNPQFALSVSGNIGSVSAPTISSTSQTLTVVDSVGSVGEYTSIAIGTDGFPVIAYRNANDLKVTKCGNAACSSGNTITTVDTVSDGIKNTSIAIGTDGFPVIAYGNFATSLKVTKCGNAACSSGNTITTVHALNTQDRISIAIGTDGFPVIAYDNGGTGDLTVTKCGNAACSSGNTITTVDSAGSVGNHASIAIGTDGFPVIAYGITPGAGEYDLKVTKCGNAACSSGNTITTVDSANGPGQYTSIAIGTDGFPVIASYESINGDLRVTKCGNAACSSGNTLTSVDTVNDVGQYTSIAIGTDGLPVVSYYDFTAGDLKVTKCGNAACSSGNTLTSVDTVNNVGRYTSIAIGTDGLPVVSYYDLTAGDLKVAKCANTSCSGTTGTALTGGSLLGGWMPNSRSYGIPFQVVNTLQIANPTTFENLKFLVGGAERMSITPAGNVGIGTTNPATTLDVSGTFRATNGTRILKRVSTAQTATTCATSDTNLNGGTFTVPANSLSTNRGLRFSAAITTTAVGAADNLRLIADFGGTNILLTTGFIVRGLGELNGTLYNRNDASSQIVVGRIDPVPQAGGTQFVSGTASVNTTTAVTFAIQCIDNDAATGGDDDTATLQMFIIEELGTD